MSIRSPLKPISVTPDPRSVPDLLLPLRSFFSVPLPPTEFLARSNFQAANWRKWTDFYHVSSYASVVLAVVIPYVCPSPVFQLLTFLKPRQTDFSTSRNPLLALSLTRLNTHTSPVLESLHWLKIEQHMQYKLISLTYKIFTTSQPTYLHYLISLQTDNNTRSSDVVTLARPSPASSLKITDRSFQYASEINSHFHFVNQLHLSVLISIHPFLLHFLHPSALHSKLITYLFGKSFPP